MIELTPLRKYQTEAVFVHPDAIHAVGLDSYKDTCVKLACGDDMYVQETPAEVARLVREWQARG